MGQLAHIVENQSVTRGIEVASEAKVDTELSSVVERVIGPRAELSIEDVPVDLPKKVTEADQEGSRQSMMAQVGDQRAVREVLVDVPKC